MRVNGKHYRTIWPAEDGFGVNVIDQTKLPHRFETLRLESMPQCATAIKSMVVRGAPLIGVTAAWGVALAMSEDPSDASLATAHDVLLATRPTAVNLAWALCRVRAALLSQAPSERALTARALAAALCDEDAAVCKAIGLHGAAILKDTWDKLGRRRPVRVLTHCNAGWLATVDWGTALAPIYRAHDEGVPVHVWVDETRPRNQGTITAWELGQHGVSHDLVVDNAGGHLMQHGLVDLCIVGTDRTTARGDVCNKIGTYLKALAAKDNAVPFYVACPLSSIDPKLHDGLVEIPIEERDPHEVTHVVGLGPAGELSTVRIAPAACTVKNHGFDVTPARLVTGLLTERGLVAPAPDDIASILRLSAEPFTPNVR